MSPGQVEGTWQLTLATEAEAVTGGLEPFTGTAFIAGKGPLALGTYVAEPDLGGCLVVASGGIFSSPSGPSTTTVTLDFFAAQPSPLGGYPVRGTLECVAVEEGVDQREVTVRATF